MDAKITPTPDGPLHAENLPALKDDAGEVISTDKDLWLCRCGASKNKPYCDGAHNDAKFTSKRIRQNPPAPAEFAGKDLTIIDDVGLCAHAGECVNGAPNTFFTKEDGKRISHPDTTPTNQVIATIRRCPSGSLLYKTGGETQAAYATESGVRVEKDGPLLVSKTKLEGDAQPATDDHYTLCRCGASLNKPFCDGMHSKVKFTDDN